MGGSGGVGAAGVAVGVLGRVDGGVEGAKVRDGDGSDCEGGGGGARGGEGGVKVLVELSLTMLNVAVSLAGDIWL